MGGVGALRRDHTSRTGSQTFLPTPLHPCRSSIFNCFCSTNSLLFLDTHLSCLYTCLACLSVCLSASLSESQTTLLVSWVARGLILPIQKRLCSCCMDNLDTRARAGNNAWQGVKAGILFSGFAFCPITPNLCQAC